ncbi:MAG: alpha/beta fold hydrolase [Candidatus Woesearchaeota archaeon]
MKLSIKNRKGQKIVVLIDKVKNQRGLVFVMHGLGGFKEQPHIVVMADAFKENLYTVVRFDTTNTLGESDGKYEDATVTNYLEDLEDVIVWSNSQEWYEQPFVLAGHSLGGICTALYAEDHPSQVRALAPISTVVSGKLSLQIKAKEEIEDWERTGWQIKPSASKPGTVKHLKWSHMIDRNKYDLLPKAEKLTMPILLIVGDKDESTPLEQQKILFNKLKTRKELHIIKDAPHTYKEKVHLEQIKSIFDAWIKQL